VESDFIRYSQDDQVDHRLHLLNPVATVRFFTYLCAAQWVEQVRVARLWPLAGVPNDGFTLTQIRGFTFAPTSGSGYLQLNQVHLMK
jgi:hypothetical protein